MRGEEPNEIPLSPHWASVLLLLVLSLFAVLTFRVSRHLILGGWRRFKTVVGLSMHLP